MLQYMGQKRWEPENAYGQTFFGEFLQGTHNPKQVECVPFAGQAQSVGNSVDRRITAQKLIGVGGPQANGRFRFIAQQQIVAGAVGGVPAEVPENVADHALRGGHAARVIAHQSSSDSSNWASRPLACSQRS
ncbi:hypothetical protein D3C85_1287790 [compost metagenome]